MVMVVQVVDGNMIVKMVVKDTPALLGNKLKITYNKVGDSRSHCQYHYHHYHHDHHHAIALHCAQGDNYFEMDIDIGSSSVAR